MTTTQQLSIFDIRQARERRDRAVAAVTAAADPAWSKAADWAIAHLACELVEFTTDDVWQHLYDFAVPSPDEPRALGGAMQRAARLGVISPTDRIVQSERPACHARPVRVWRSLVLNRELPLDD